MVDTKVCTTSYRFYSFQLSPIICEDPFGYAKSVYDTLQEFDYWFLCYVHHWHSFHPLGERVNSDE
jgi:hypothetical protein